MHVDNIGTEMVDGQGMTDDLQFNTINKLKTCS